LRAAITAREEGSRNTGLMDRWQVRPAWPADKAGSHICYPPVYGLQCAHRGYWAEWGCSSEADMVYSGLPAFHRRQPRVVAGRTQSANGSGRSMWLFV
jgi:hypothetical protein